MFVDTLEVLGFDKRKGKEGDCIELLFASSSQPFAVLWFDVPGCAG